VRLDPLHRALAEAEARLGVAVEVYAKQSRTRRFEHGLSGDEIVSTEERGWAVRAGDERKSLFASWSGEPRRIDAWPAPRRGCLRLPPAVSSGPWSAVPEVETPLLGEVEGQALLASMRAGFEAEHVEGRWLRGVLEEASGSVGLVSSSGIATDHRTRLASLRLEAETASGEVCVLDAAARRAQDFAVAALARRLGDLVSVRGSGRAVSAEATAIVLGPEVAAHLLGAVVEAFVGSAPRLELESRQGLVADRGLTLIEDGRWSRGILAAPCDGEGVPCRRRMLVDRGSAGERILPWWESPEPIGSRWRAGWRDAPKSGPSQLWIEADPGVSPADLLADVGHGYYLLAATGAGVFDLARDGFSLPVCGFAIGGGRVEGAVQGTRLEGRLSDLLHRVVARGRDLSFHARGAVIGSPTLLVSGLDLVAAAT